MNNVSEQLLEAMDILTDAKVEKLQFDKTIKASIFSIANVDTGEYKVRYTGNIFSAYAQDGKMYRTGEDVYVKIPEGDFSNKKIIEGRVSETSLSYNEMIGLQNSVESVSPTLDEFYDFDSSKGLVAGSDIKEIEIFPAREEFAAGGPDLLFQQYANEYETLRISAEFKTNLYSEHTSGNYGIKVTFFANDDTEVSYNLDVESFNGAPYRFMVYTPQSVFLKVQKGYLKGLKSITFFQDKFKYDRFIVNGIPGEENTEISNLFVTNVKIDYVDIKDLTQEPLYLQISAPQGTLLTTQTQNIDLVGKLLANGEDVLSTSTCQCTWYKRDLSVIPGDEAYSKPAGIGWRAIKGDFNKLSLSFADVAFVNEYKLLIIYNERTPIFATVKVTNTLSEYSCSLVQDTRESSIYLRINGNKDYTGIWYIQYPDGAYNRISDDKVPEIDITTYLKYTTLTFYCQVFDGDNVIANLSHQIVSSENEEDIIVTYEGDSSFRYDANGDITVDDYEKDRWLYAKFTWKDGMGSSFKVEWRGPDGKVLTSEGYNPANSMITNIRIDKDYRVWYNISRKYNINYNDNTLQLVVSTIDGQIYKFYKTLLFIKDGDQGTNGTTYVAAIRPYESDIKPKSGFNPLVYKDGWIDSQAYYCYVYKDGEQINSSDQFDITYNWTSENLVLTTPEEAMITAAGGSSSPDVTHYLKVTVNVTTDGKTTQLYAIYPVDVIVGELDKDKVDITSIPQFIKYSSSGKNPVYENNPIEFLYDTNDFSDKIISQNKTVLDVFSMNNGDQTGKKSYYLKPAITYHGDDEQPMGLLKCEESENNYIMHPVIMYLDTFGNEAINGWDGTKLEIDEEKGQYIFAPQIGAGEKNSQNQFTGLLMGLGNIDNNGKKWGLYGFNTGTNTFGMDVDGRAWFGRANERINFNATGGATITGGGGGNSTNGMTITLAKNGNTNAIRIGNGKFNVTYDGVLTATEANITGSITADSGHIGDWLIFGGTISNGPTTLTADGEIKCGSGIIGGWEISEYQISSDNITLNPSIIQIKNGKMQADYFQIYHNGVEHGRLGYIEGDNQSGTTDHIGIKSFDGYGIILESDTNGRFSTDSYSGGLYFEALNHGNITIRTGENGVDTNNRIYLGPETGIEIEGLNINVTSGGTKIIEDGKIYARFK